MIRPLRDQIVFEPITPAQKLGAIFIPDVASKSTRNQTFQYATVIAAGPQCDLVKPGCTILLSEYAVEPFDLNGTPVHMVRERDIIGIVEFSEEETPAKITQKRKFTLTPV